MGPENSFRTLSDYVSVVRRRFWVAFLPLVIIPTVATFVSLRQAPLYRASSQVLLIRQSLAATLSGTQDPTSLDADRLAETQATIARAPALARRVARAAGADQMTPETLLHDSTVSHRTDTDLLDFRVENEDRVLAIRLANSYATQFTIYRRQLDTSTLQAAVNEVQQRIRQLHLNPKSQLYATLIAREQQLKVLEALQTANTRVVKRADRASKVRPQPQRNLLFGALSGLIVGLGLALLVEALDKRVRSEDELEQLLQMPLLGRLPTPPRHLRRANRLAMLDEPRGPDAEAIRKLRTMLEFASLDDEVGMIAITSAVAREGKSTTAANLAIAIARAGRRVVLVDADLREPFIHVFFGITEQRGVTDVVLGRLSLEQALRNISLQFSRNRYALALVNREDGQEASRGGGSLEILPAGTPVPAPGEFIASRKFESVFSELRKRADVVIVDTPPLLAVGETLALVSKADGLIAVVRAKMTHRTTLDEVRRVLGEVRSKRLGFVITQASRHEGYGYGHRYGYGRVSQALEAGTGTGTDTGTAVEAPAPEVVKRPPSRRTPPRERRAREGGS